MVVAITLGILIVGAVVAFLFFRRRRQYPPAHPAASLVSPALGTSYQGPSGYGPAVYGDHSPTDLPKYEHFEQQSRGYESSHAELPGEQLDVQELDSQPMPQPENR
jgi:hypothetical protein